MTRGVNRFVTSTTVSLQRFQGTAFWIALVVFVAVYVLIAFEILHRTLAAFLGAAVLLVITHTFGHFDETVQHSHVRAGAPCGGLERDLPAHGHDDHRGCAEGLRRVPVACVQILPGGERKDIPPFFGPVHRHGGHERVSGQCDHHAPAHTGDSGNRSGAWGISVRFSDAGDSCLEFRRHGHAHR